MLIRLAFRQNNFLKRLYPAGGSSGYEYELYHVENFISLSFPPSGIRPAGQILSVPTVFGCNLHIRDELMSDAFASLPEQEQSILLLYCVLKLTDGEIGSIAGMYRSAV